MLVRNILRQYSMLLLIMKKRPYSVRVRFAPSPTGSLHLGGYRTALLNYIFAQKYSGDFILRIEDTDQDRAIPNSAEKLEEDLQWLRIPPSESPIKGGSFGPYVQSERKSLYKEEVNRLIERGHAYPCFCSEKRLDLLRKDAARRREPSKYDGKCRELTQQEIKKKTDSGEIYCVRFKLPPPPYRFKDAISGTVSIEEQQGDFVIMKSDGYPTYHLASVVDDYHMKITHVLRGIEWQISTGKHIALYNALGYTPPVFAHLPLILNRDGSKLSKRQSDISIDYYRTKNYFPEAIANFVMGNRNRIQSMEEIISEFELETLSKSSHKLDFAYLEILNRICLQNQAEDNLDVLRTWFPDESEEFCRRILKWCPQRISKLADLTTEFPFLTKNFQPLKCSPEEIQFIHLVLKTLEKSTGDVNHVLFKNLSAETNIPIQKLMLALRKSLCGVEAGPPVFEVINLLGKDESIRRLKNCST